MDGFKLLFYLNFIIALIAALIVGLSGLWIFFIWMILPLGIIAGFLKKYDENDTMFLIAGVVFVIVGEKLASSFIAITGIGQFLSSFLDAMVLFFVSTLAVFSLRKLWVQRRGGLVKKK